MSTALIEKPITRTALRLPPYAKKVLALRKDGFAPNLAVLVVDGWTPADTTEYAPWVLVIPDGEPVTQFDFGCVAGLHVVILAATASRVDDIAQHLDRFAPMQMWGWPEDWPRLTYFQRRAA